MKIYKTLFAFALCILSFNLFATPIDINTASAKELAAALKGVGPAKAQSIVDYRETHGPYTEAAQLEKVKGIGAATVSKNLENILIVPSEQEQ